MYTARRVFHLERPVRAMVVVLVDQVIEALLLLQKVEGSGFGGFLLQGEMHPLVTAIVMEIDENSPKAKKRYLVFGE